MSKKTFSIYKLVCAEYWKKMLFFYILFIILMILFPLIMPMIHRSVLDALSLSDERLFYRASIFWGVLIISVVILQYISNSRLDVLCDEVSLHANRNFLMLYDRNPLNMFGGEFAIGDVSNRIQSGTQGVVGLLSISSKLIGTLIGEILLLSLFSPGGPMVLFLLAVVLTIDIVFSVIKTKLLTRFQSQKQVYEVTRENLIREYVQKTNVIQMHGLVDQYLEKISINRNEIWRVQWKITVIDTLLTSVCEMASSVLRACLIITVYPLYLTGGVSAGVTTALLEAYDSIRASVLDIRNSISAIPGAIAPVRRLQEFIASLKSESKVVRKNQGESAPIICASHISLSNNKGRPLLNNVSIEIHRGEKVAIIGKNGSGKSTLLRILLGLYEAQGQVCIENKDSADWNQHVSYAPSQPHLYTLTAKDNILNGDDRCGRTYRIAKELDIDFWDCYPTELSGGQAQRINLARAYAQNRPIIFLDEPTSSLDKAFGMRMMKTLINECETVVAVTHDTELLALFDRIILLKSGNMVASGPFEQINNDSCFIEWISTT